MTTVSKDRIVWFQVISATNQSMHQTQLSQLRAERVVVNINFNNSKLSWKSDDSKLPTATTADNINA